MREIDECGMSKFSKLGSCDKTIAALEGQMVDTRSETGWA